MINFYSSSRKLIQEVYKISLEFLAMSTCVLYICMFMYGFEVCVYMHMCMCRYGYIRINGSVEEEKGWNWNKIKQATWKTYASYFCPLILQSRYRVWKYQRRIRRKGCRQARRIILAGRESAAGKASMDFMIPCLGLWTSNSEHPHISNSCTQALLFPPFFH